ncbi:MAG: hypothetical protein GY705_06310 [Bacteroidetes bacterium]|nr:hypothetical protein [Bacteroidota bacterium]
MGLYEFKRGNEVYDSEIDYPLKYVKKIQVTEGKEWIDNIRIIENKLYVSARTYLMCFDLEKGKMIWEKRSKKVSIPVGGKKKYTPFLIEYRVAWTQNLVRLFGRLIMTSF